MKSISQETIQKILNLADAQTIIGRYVQLSKKGDRFWGLSPFQSEKTPSFCVDSVKKLYYCFSTNQGGSIFTFVQKMENVGFVEAVHMIAKEVGVLISDGKDDVKQTQADTEKYVLKEILSRISKTFEHFFNTQESAVHARTYMEQRKITQNTLKKFQIGYAPAGKNWLFSFLTGKGYEASKIAELGLFSKKYREISLFSNRIMFPIIDSSNTIVGFGGRIINTEGPKYINSPQSTIFHKKHMLYGLTQSIDGIKKYNKVFLVEGYLDVMAIHEAGIDAAVAPLGTAFTEDQAKLIHRISKEIVMVFDNDSAGWNAAVKSAIVCEKAHISSIKIIILAENDAGDILQNQGKEALYEALLGVTKNEHEWFEYYLQKVFPGVNASYQEKEKVLYTLTNYLVEVQSQYKYASYINRIAEVFSINSTLLEKIMKKVTQNNNFYYNNRVNKQDVPDYKENHIENNLVVDSTTELLALATICANPHLFEKIRILCKSTDLEDNNAREIYLTLEKAFRANQLTIQGVLDLLPYHIRKKVIHLIAGGETVSNDDEVFIKNVHYHMKLNRLEKLSICVDINIRKLHAQTNEDTVYHKGRNPNKEINELLQEKHYYVKLISELKKEYNKNKKYKVGS